MNNYDKVALFLRVGGIKQGELANIRTDATARSTERSYALIMEEFNELEEAMEKFRADRSLQTLIDVTDALIDIEYVINNMHYELGLPAMKLFNEVHESNMRKLLPCPSCQVSKEDGCVVCNYTGYVVRKSPVGKILKPEGWQKPDISKVLCRAYEESVDRVTELRDVKGAGE